MTRLLATRAARVIAIERDPNLARALSEQVQHESEKWPGVEIITADVLTCDFARLSQGRFRVYGNLPYYITSPILHHLFQSAERIDSIHVVIQLEVAERIAAHSGSRDYGYLSVVSQFYSRPEIVLRIPPGAFQPPPKVYSALVQMNTPGERANAGIDAGNEGAFLEFVQRCFRQKRRTLRNNLRALSSDAGIQKALQICSLRADARAEQLTVAQFSQLFSCFAEEHAEPQRGDATFR
jgi:16S rRNA (adenine1518-N6/adenine1519-N6)-dimethyltransferase